MPALIASQRPSGLAASRWAVNSLCSTNRDSLASLRDSNAGSAVLRLQSKSPAARSQKMSPPVSTINKRVLVTVQDGRRHTSRKAPDAVYGAWVQLMRSTTGAHLKE